MGATAAVATQPSLAAHHRADGSNSWTSPATAASTSSIFRSRLPGFYERTLERVGRASAPSAHCPCGDWRDPNLRFVDLTGDGIADVLITEDDAFTWHRRCSEEGFGAGDPRPPSL